MKDWQTNLTLTHISPIHIGAGQDLDPTEYVIHDGILHRFTHLQMFQALPTHTLEALGELAQKAQTPQDQLTLRGLIYQNRETLAHHAPFQFLASQLLVQTYQNTINKQAHSGNKSQNKLELLRHSHNPTDQKAYIPGSTLKGAIRTAITNPLAQQAGTRPDPRAKSSDIEKQILNYKNVDDDPFKRLKISDAQSPHTIQKFQKCHNYHNRMDKQSGKNMPVTLETTQIGSQFQFQMQFKPYDSEKPNHNPFYIEPQQILNELNRFYLPKLTKQLNQAQTDKRINQAWSKQTQALLQKLAPLIQQQKIGFIRLGHYAGGQSKSWDNLRQIENRKIKDKKDPKKYMQEANTFWLTEDQYPLGWAIISMTDPTPQPLSEFIEQLAQSDLQQLAKIQTQKQQYAQQKQQQQAERQRQEQAAKLRQQQEQQKQEKLNSLSDTQRQIYQLQTAFEQEKAHKLQNPAGELRQQINHLIDQAHNQAWSNQDKQALKTLCLEIFNYWNINPKKNAKVKEKLKLLNG